MVVLPPTPARRRASRIPISLDVWVYWEGLPHRDVSRVRDLSHAGLFLETHFRKNQGELLLVHFLVEEGQIRLEARVKHTSAGQGLGLRLHSVVPYDIAPFDALLTRIRASARLPLPQPA